MKIKLALPTEDKLHISDSMFKADFFKIITFDSVNIIQEEYRDVHSGMNNKEIYDMISDCDVILFRAISKEFTEYLKTQKKQVIITTEKIITNAALKYVSEFYQRESNTCCCP
jgi:hypothetical protein